MTKPVPPLALIWLRRDLRLEDHAPLAWAEAEGFQAAFTFVFDETILRKLPQNDRRVSFFHGALEEIDSALQKRDSALVTRVGDPVREIPKLAKALGAQVVITGRDYEPYAKKRDSAVADELKRLGIRFLSLKDQVIFEQAEILSKTGGPYKVFTAYKNNWLEKLSTKDYEKRGHSLPALLPRSALAKEIQRWDLKTLGFTPEKLWLETGPAAAKKRLTSFEKEISEYKTARDLPAVQGTSGLSAHLRFGTISVRACVRTALAHRGVGAETWLSELVWRDFYHMILDRFPQVGRGEAFRPEYENIRWPGKAEHLEAWKQGRTGFPIVDAAMRHFNETGWMHNRLRMVVASFLVKDLLIDWREGEAYFARGLLDFDLAANNGGWQWSASTGCDAQPYFRIFNPYSQSKKFDPEGTFIRAHLPELRNCSAKDIHEPSPLLTGYPPPLVDHSKQREKALALFKKA